MCPVLWAPDRRRNGTEAHGRTERHIEDPAIGGGEKIAFGNE
jgi:hypothetical protein